MKHIYALFVVLAFFAVDVFAQTYTWSNTPMDNNWNNPGNWTGGSVPNANTANVVFNANAVVNLATDITIKSLAINGSATVRINGSTNLETISVNSNSGAATITVAASATLELYQLTMLLPNNIQGTVNGHLVLKGNNEADYALMEFPQTVGDESSFFNINGSLTDEFGSSIISVSDSYLRFNAGSKYNIIGQQPSIVRGTYHSTSEIVVTGVINLPLTIRESYMIGSLTYNCPNQIDDPQLMYLGIPSQLIISGSLNILNTNNHTLQLFSNSLPSNDNVYSITINGDFNISGTSHVALSYANNNTESYWAEVKGNFNMNGGVFNLQNSNLSGLQPLTLFVKGNINHTGGTITANSSQIASSHSLFNIEMNGTTPQTITSSSKVFNNTNNQVALRISNPAGVTLLSELQVGMLGFSNNGRLITSQTGDRILKVLNPSTANHIISGSGYVDGPVRRATNSTNEYIFPTGNGGVSRYVSVFPTSTDQTTYQASYTNSSPSNTNINSPLTGIANYYWEVDRIGTGANAQVEITLPGAISGSTSTDAMLVAKSSGGLNWERAKGTAGNFLPGDAVSGKLISDIQSSFSSFTIGWGPMDAALPITLVSFTANKAGNTAARLNWRITETSTPEVFEVMKSTDGRSFSKIASISGVTSKLSYDFTDNNLNSGNNHYRLKMIDKDGSVSFSNIIVVMNGTHETLISSMIPTVVNDRARLNISAAEKGNLQLVITDINGRVIQTQTTAINPGNQEVWINASRLSSGYFQITGYINGQRTQTIRFLKR